MIHTNNTETILRWTVLKDIHGRSIEELDGSVDEFIKSLEAVKARDKKSCPLITLVDFGDKTSSNGSLRNNANVLRIQGVIGDYDEGLVKMEEAQQILTSAGIFSILYPTPSNTVEKPRWRVIAPTSTQMPTAEHRRLTERLNAILKGVLAKESFTLSQSYYFGDVGTNNYKVIKTDGIFIDKLEPSQELEAPKQIESIKQAGTDTFLAPSLIDDLRSALAHMAPDDRDLWQRMGHALKTIGNAGLDLWLEWSSKSDKYDLAKELKTWESFKPTNTGYQAVFAEASRQGWINPLSSNSTVIAEVKKVSPIKAGTDISSLFQSLTLNKEDVSTMAEAEFLIPNMIVRGHLLSYMSPGNGGKTTIFVYLCEKLAEQGLNVLYINVDGSPADLKRHYEHASVHGYKVIAPDAKTGKSTEDVLAIFEAIAMGEARCDDVVIVIDTLKKFLDVINKQHSKKFYKMLRAITVKGATICLLGHTNKYAGEDGKTIYEGTGDTRNDVDELIYLDSCPNTYKNTLEVTTRPDKVRAEFHPRSFIIQLPDRQVTESPSPINILANEDKKMLELMNEAIGSGLHSQQDIVAYVESRTSHSTKKIRTRLIKFSQNNPPDIVARKTGVRKEISYELAPVMPSLFAGVTAK
jgi:hypothetical protein